VIGKREKVRFETGFKSRLQNCPSMSGYAEGEKSNYWVKIHKKLERQKKI